MNDDFLYDLRVPPRRAFSTALYRRISLERKTRLSLPLFSLKRFAWAAAVLALALGAIVLAYPEVGAQTGAVIRKIGQMVFTDTWIYPKAASTPILVWTPQRETMTLAQVQRTLPFTPKAPTWMPEGYISYDPVTVTTLFPPKECSKCQTGWIVEMMWRKPISTPLDYGKSRITLRINYPTATTQRPADLQTLEELTINGQPAALMGHWGIAPANPRDPNLSKDLVWIQDDTLYDLAGIPGVRAEDLIRMAESIK